MFQSKRAKQTRPAMPRRRETRPAAMPRGRGARPAMPRGRWPRPAMMPRGRVPPRPRRPPTDRERRLAEEVLHLHSLWHRGPPDPVPNPEPEPAPAQSHSADRKTKTSDRKRRKLDAAAAAEPKDTGSEWAIAPAPPNSSPKSWPDAAPSSSTPAKPPPPPASPGALAQQKALRAAAEFFSNRGDSSSSDSSDDDEEGSEEQEGEQDAAGFLTGLFERDAALRGHYERGCESGQFACMVCAAGTRKARRFGGCKALVQHAHDATPRYGRRRAHRALAAVLCRVLGWDVARLPSIVIDPRGTLGQALAAGAVAAAAVQLPKENGDSGEDYDSSSDEDEEDDVETGMEDSSTDHDKEENELESSEESAEMEDVETGMEDSSTDGDEEENELESSEEYAEKDLEKGTEDSENPDDDGEVIELNNGEKSALKEAMEEIGPSTCKEISKNEVLCNESVQEVNASKDDSLNQGNNGEVRNQEIAKESSEKEENFGENKEEHGDW
ncbi:unnamed protein product [Urochloa decumbens]|uniref:Uncharacterized protein n=1 Tax=Urochloa decumbens TaxID=240449 RepID=A0ABC9E5U3_9POAL